MSDETEEYIESVSIPTLVWIGEPGSGRREMASAFVKARFSTMALDGTIAEKPEWNRFFRTGTAPNPCRRGSVRIIMRVSVSLMRRKERKRTP